MKLFFQNKTLTLLSLVLFGPFFFSCGKQDDKATEEKSSPPVKVINPSVTNLNDYLTLNANTIFQKKEIVRATFQGFVVKFFNKIGDRIKSGDELLQIQTKESSAEGDMDIKLSKQSFKGKVTVLAKQQEYLPS